jgi:site-specific DNA recombinase
LALTVVRRISLIMSLAPRRARSLRRSMPRASRAHAGKWNSSTLNGSRSRANGVLQNRQYIGEIVWNRQRFIKDPATGKRVSRLNPESEWQHSQAPHLAIVDRTVFGLAGARKAERTQASGPVAAKPRHFLSHLPGWTDLDPFFGSTPCCRSMTAFMRCNQQSSP